MSDSTVNAHLEGIISDFEGCQEKKGQVRETYRFSLSSISSSLPPLFLFQHLIHSQPLLHPPSHVRAWLLMGVRPPEYPACPSLTNTYPLGNASTLVPGSFSVNTSLFLVCAKSLLTSVSLFRSLKQDSGAER
ncbi:hypothetical protein D4764_18G0006950 [Takifugu flavidus]|uniref:Uncharacterized protein n=1 Tax=Takifugu flavidus TaxID=433684 RepID=A0A5C6NTB7_9TELE|nr:hypothetical protein D4764_18G0006950 [Takifugu flavidus]